MSAQRDAARRFLVQAGLPLCHLASLTALVVEAERRGAAEFAKAIGDRCSISLLDGLAQTGEDVANQDG